MVKFKLKILVRDGIIFCFVKFLNMNCLVVDNYWKGK